jgi:uncharacterized protein
MAQLLVDTSALLAFFFKSEKNHLAAQDYIRRHPRLEWVILNTVFAETVTWVRVKVSIPHSIQVGQLLRDNHDYLQLSPADDEATWEVFRRYRDKEWSYTDCSIAAMSRRLAIQDVFAFDEHIRQMAGLNVHCVP